MTRYHSCRPVFLLLSLLCLIVPGLLSGCRRESPPQAAVPQIQQSARQVDGIAIPVMPTAAEQLLFAGSNLHDPAVKKAAFKAVFEFHPDAGPEQKRAALELAYLQLGEDYRLATQDQCRQALASYAEIFKKYGVDPEVAAKALWYQGWIYSALLADPAAGEKYFRQIIHTYPLAIIEYQPAPPWLNLEEDPQVHTSPPPNGSSLRWADLAGIELIRNTVDDHQATTLTARMLQKSPQQPLSSLLVKNLLLFHGNSQEAYDLATAYLDKAAEQDEILGDIRLIVARIARPGRAEGTAP